MITYYDAHTHRHYSELSGVVSVYNYRVGRDSCVPQGRFSVGIHPYDASEFAKRGEWAMRLEELEELAQNPMCVAIGECGIDMRIEGLDEQREVFRAQIAIAQALRKPLIVHLVRSLDEVLSLTKGFENPILLHSFHKWSDAIARRGNIFVSFAHRNIVGLKRVDISRLLLETDDSPTPIAELYRRLSECYKVDIEELVKQMEQNFNNFYSI